MKSELRQKLVEAIEWEIGNCKESGLYPNICDFSENESGYNQIIENVIKLVAEDGFRIDSALAQIESSL